MFNKNDSLVQSVQQVMKENTIRRQIEETVNAEFGVVSRKQLTLEQLSSYDSRLEEAINKALKGNQHKIDANKNNKIDSQDFKILRSMKEEEEGEETREGGAVTKDGKEVVSPTAPRAEPEGPSKSDREALTAKIKGIMKESGEMGPDKRDPKKEDAKTYRHKTSEKEIVSTKHPGEEWELVKEEQLDEAYKGRHPKKIKTVFTGKESKGTVSVTTNDGSTHNISAKDTKGVMPKPGEHISKYVKEEQLDEISKGKLADYIKAASHDVATKSAATGRYADRANRVSDEMKKGDYSNFTQGKKDNETADKMFAKSWKRRKGIAKAADKMVKEEQLDEKAVSKAQQKIMGMALAMRRGESDVGSKKVAKIAADMSEKELKKFAGTKHKGLPEKKEKIKEEHLEEKKLTEDKTKDSVIDNHRKMINYHKKMENKHSGVRFDSLHSNAAYAHQNAIDDHEKAIERYKKNPNDIDYKLAALNAENSTKKAKESSDHLYVREDVDYEAERVLAEDKITLESVLAEIQANLGEQTYGTLRQQPAKQPTIQRMGGRVANPPSSMNARPQTPTGSMVGGADDTDEGPAGATSFARGATPNAAPAPRTRSISGNQSSTNKPFDNSRAASQPGMQQAKPATAGDIADVRAGRRIGTSDSTENAAQAAGYGDTEAFGRGSTPPPKAAIPPSATSSRRTPAEPLPSPTPPPAAQPAAQPASTGDEALASRPPAPPVAPATSPAVRRAAQPASTGSRAPEPAAPAAPEPAAPAEPKSRQMFQAAQDNDNPAAFFRADKQLSKERASMNESFEQFAKRFINEKR